MIDKAIVDKLRLILHNFGVDNQRVKLFEECNEFIDSMENEEIADIAVLSLQFVLFDKEIFDIFVAKINRTIKRIESGYYEPR